MFGRGFIAGAGIAASLLSTVAAAPTTSPELAKRANIDTTVLQFALTLEHLEAAFYKQALTQFNYQDFQSAGYSIDYYNNLHFIEYDEQQHVLLLEGALKNAGVTPVAACTYNFNFTDVTSFITLSSVLEGVGTSAYLGGAGLITSKAYLTVAGSILAVEALHTSMQRLAIGEVPMANYLMTPLDPTSVYTLAAAFIKSCPSSNAKLPFTPFPSLSTDGQTCTCEEVQCGNPSQYVKRDASAEPSTDIEARSSYAGSCSPPVVGNTVTFTTRKPIPAGSYVTFVNGLTVTSVKGTNAKKYHLSAAIPQGIAGQTYVFITKSDVETTFSDSAVLFGPSILEVKPAAPVNNPSAYKA